MGAYIKYTGQYKNGLYDGEGHLYYPNTSTKMILAKFKDGKIDEDLPATLYHKNGVIKYHGGIKAHIKEGTAIEYHDNGVVRHVNGHYENDVLNGKQVETYNSDGKLIYIGNYKDGIIEGSGKEFYEDTDQQVKLISENFINGLANGNKNKIFWKNSKVKYEGQMKNGKLHGQVKVRFLYYRVNYITNQEP